MAYNTETQIYELTRWPSPYDGSTLPENQRFLSYNIIAMELLKPFTNKKKTSNFFINNTYQYPSSLEFDTYSHSLSAKQGTMVLYLSGQKLIQNLHYTYSYEFKRFRLLSIEPPPGSTVIGVLHCEYVPESDDDSYLYETFSAQFLKNNGLIVRREPSSYIYEIINLSRGAVENAWSFLKKDPPLWVGGFENQNLGSNNLIKYITAISSTHINELITELVALNDYINLRFAEAVTIDFPANIVDENTLSGDMLSSIMLTLNEIETKFNLILENEENHSLLDLTGV